MTVALQGRVELRGDCRRAGRRMRRGASLCARGPLHRPHPAPRRLCMRMHGAHVIHYVGYRSLVTLQLKSKYKSGADVTVINTESRALDMDAAAQAVRVR